MRDVKPPKGWKFVDEPYRPIPGPDGHGLALGWHAEDGTVGIYRVSYRSGILWLAPDDTPPPRRWEADDGSGWWEECEEPFGKFNGLATAMFESDGARILTLAGGRRRCECWVRFVPRESK